jgi:hypothetical protein
MSDFYGSFQYSTSEDTRIKSPVPMIYSYKVSSVPAQKRTNFLLKAEKKVLSPVPTIKFPKLVYPFNSEKKRQHDRKEIEIKETIDRKFTGTPSKLRWKQKHYSCYEKTYKEPNESRNGNRETLQLRRPSLSNQWEFPVRIKH